MYQELINEGTGEPLLTIPTDETILYKYFSKIEYFMDLICSESLFFSRISNWSKDKNEGLIPDNIQDEIIQDWIDNYKNSRTIPDNKQFKKDQLKLYKFLTYFRYACCFHINTQESRYMWDKFLDNECPIAIKTSVGKVRRLLENYTNFTFGPVLYHRKKLVIDFLSVDDYRLFYKRKKYKKEKEFRVLLLEPDPYDSFKEMNPQFISSKVNDLGCRDIEIPDIFDDNVSSQSGRYIPLIPDLFIDEIILRPNADKKLESFISEFIIRKNGNSSHLTIKRSDLEKRK